MKGIVLAGGSGTRFVVVPNQRSKPNRPMILMIWIFLGSIVGAGMIFGKEYLDTILKKWNE